MTSNNLKYYYIPAGTELDQIERETGHVSYRRVIEDYVGDIVLCNNIIEVDPSVIENMSCEEIDNSEQIEEIREKIGELEELITMESTEEEDQKTTQKIEELEEQIEELEEEQESSSVYNREVYQWYMCNLSEYNLEQLHDYGIITSYSDLLDCDIICVDHWGSSWSIVPCDAVITNDWELYKRSAGIWNS